MLADGTFDFELRKSIEVAGCKDPVTALTFHECGEGYDSYYMKLRKFVLSAMLKAPELMEKLGKFVNKDDNKNDDLPAGDELKPLHQTDEADHLVDSKGMAEVLKITLGTSDDLEELVTQFGFMVANTGNAAICTVDGTRIKEGAWKRLHPEDKIDAAVRYCSFFGIGLDLPSNNESEVASESHTEVKVL